MSISWYYADSQNQQCGPVDTDWLATAYRSGKLHAATLVWRDGLAAWVPLSQIAGELGLPAGVTMPPPVSPRTMPGRVVIAKPASSGGWVVGLVVGLFCVIAFGGILAAIALPAYQDYTVRAKIALVLVEVEGRQTEVNEFYRSENRCPKNGEGNFLQAAEYANQSIAAMHFHPLDSGECAIEAVFRSSGAGAIAGKQLRARMDAQGRWSHDSDLAPRYLPLSMRQENSTKR